MPQNAPREASREKKDAMHVIRFPYGCKYSVQSAVEVIDLGLSTRRALCENFLWLSSSVCSVLSPLFHLFPPCIFACVVLLVSGSVRPSVPLLLLFASGLMSRSVYLSAYLSGAIMSLVHENMCNV